MVYQHCNWYLWRYIHTHNAIFDIRDYYAAKAILGKLIETIDEKFIEDVRK